MSKGQLDGRVAGRLCQWLCHKDLVKVQSSWAFLFVAQCRDALLAGQARAAPVSSEAASDAALGVSPERIRARGHADQQQGDWELYGYSGAP